jgi:cell division protein ZapA (FtsZ GTPase activity inhibitor)
VIFTSHEYVVRVTTFLNACHELKEMHGKIKDLFPQKISRKEKESKEGSKKIKK